MTFDDAKRILVAHSGQLPDDPRFEAGFLGMLRIYDGLVEQNFREVMEAIRVLAPHLQTAPLLDREVVNALWGIHFWARSWGLEPDGLVRRNRLMSDADLQRLDAWVRAIGGTVAGILDGVSYEEALASFGNLP